MGVCCFLSRYIFLENFQCSGVVSESLNSRCVLTERADWKMLIKIEREIGEETRRGFLCSVTSVFLLLFLIYLN